MILNQGLKQLISDMIAAIKSQQVGEVKRLVKFIEDNDYNHKIVYSYKDKVTKASIYEHALENCPNFYIFWLIYRTNINNERYSHSLFMHVVKGPNFINKKVINIDPFGKRLVDYYGYSFKQAQELADTFIRYNLLTGKFLPNEIWGIVFIYKAMSLYDLSYEQLRLVYENRLELIKSRIAPKLFTKNKEHYDLAIESMDRVSEFLCNKLQHATTAPTYYKCKDAVLDSVSTNRFDVFLFSIYNISVPVEKVFDKCGSGLLHVAAQSGAIEVLNYLLVQNFDVNQKNLQNQTPLMISIKSNQYNFTSALLQKGAEITEGVIMLAYQRDKKIFENIKMTSENYNKTILHLLVQNGANIYELGERHLSFYGFVKINWPEIYPMLVNDAKSIPRNNPKPKINSPALCFQGKLETMARM